MQAPKRKPLAALGAVLAIAAVLFSLAACDELEKRRIARILDARAEALTSSDPAGYMSFFAPDYRCEYTTLDAARASVTRILTKANPVKAAFGERDIQIKGEKALVSEKYSIEVNVSGSSRRFEGVQHIYLKRSGDGWSCESGSEILEILGVRAEEERLIEQTLLRREAALVNKDVIAYMALISDDYSHEGEGPEEIREKVLQLFRYYDNIEFKSYDRRIFFMGQAATVKQKFTMNADKVGSPQTISSEEKFELEKTENGWKFTKGL